MLNRHGDAQWAKGAGARLPTDLVGPVAFDSVLYPGDVLYIPRGWPHSTTTASRAGDGDGEEEAAVAAAAAPFSVAMTVAVSSESQFLVYEKLLRCASALSL